MKHERTGGVGRQVGWRKGPGVAHFLTNSMNGATGREARANCMANGASSSGGNSSFGYRDESYARGAGHFIGTRIVASGEITCDPPGLTFDPGEFFADA